MASFVVDNNVESLVADDPLTSGAVTLNVNTGHGARFPSTFPYRLTIWDDSTYPDPTDDSNMEVVNCTARSTDALTIARGEEGTSGVEHALGSRVALLFTAGLFNDATYGVATKLDTIDTNADVTGSNPPQAHAMSTHTDEGALSTLNTVDTAQIDDDAVLYAKIQNIVNDERILGRVSGADGIVEELTATQVLAMIGVESGADVTDAFNVAQAWLGEADKNTPANDDTIPIADSAASNVMKKLKWSNLKATLKTYFDTLYNLYVHPNHSGDVTSVADGAQTIVADAVTYAKMQNVTGGDRILGRSTAGGGIVEEVTCTAAARAFLDDANVATQVDTLGLNNAKTVNQMLWAESAYLPATNPAGLVEELGATTYAGFSYLTFDDTTSEHAVWRVPMPDYDGGNIIVTSFSKIATTPGGAVTGQYNILTIGLSNSEEFDAASTADTGVNISHSFFTTESLTEIMTASATINPANVAADDLMVIELSRDVASDNLPGDLELVGILIEYTRT